jgi:tetratricopeptide (TPR) repeat protein
MLRYLPALILLAFLSAPFHSRAETKDALALYKSGDYETALPQLQAAATQNPKDANLRAALLSALVYKGRTNEAAEAAEAASNDFPLSPEMMTARAEFFYYMGDFKEAERLYKAALKLNQDNARACYGVYRLLYAASQYRSARLVDCPSHLVTN